MAPNIFITETQTANTISPKISLSDFPILYPTPTTQDKTSTPNSYAAVSWATLSQQQLAMDPTIAALTR